MANNDTHSLVDRARSDAGTSGMSASESTDDRPVSRAIRAALVARGTSLRGWALDWAERTGESKVGAYPTLRMTLLRRLDQGLAPRGERGGRMVRALRAELGADLVPYGRGEATEDREAA